MLMAMPPSLAFYNNPLGESNPAKDPQPLDLKEEDRFEDSLTDSEDNQSGALNLSHRSGSPLKRSGRPDVHNALTAALQSGQMSLNQLSSLSPSSVWEGNPLAAALAHNSERSSNNNNDITRNSGVSNMDLNCLTLALQQQQLQNLLLFGSGNPVAAAASTVLLQNQVQQAVAQATNQLKLLKREQQRREAEENEKNKFHPSLPDTPKSMPRSSPEAEKKTYPTDLSLALSSLTPIPPSTPPAHRTPLSFGALSPEEVGGRSASLSPPEETGKDPSENHRLEIPSDENVDLEELEQFAKEFKQRRIKLGYTQGDVGLAMGKMYGNDFSQTTISRFEALNLSFKNMCKLKPLLEKWLDDADGSIPASNSFPSAQLCADLLGKRRKKRTSIESAVRTALEKAFIKNPKPTSEEIRLIGEGLCMEKEVVRVWFCNRRQKEKRINPALSSSSTNPPCDFQLFSQNPGEIGDQGSSRL